MSANVATNSGVGVVMTYVTADKRSASLEVFCAKKLDDLLDQPCRALFWNPVTATLGYGARLILSELSSAVQTFGRRS
jgi:hypothetical protein